MAIPIHQYAMFPSAILQVLWSVIATLVIKNAYMIAELLGQPPIPVHTCDSAAAVPRADEYIRYIDMHPFLLQLHTSKIIVTLRWTCI